MDRHPRQPDRQRQRRPRCAGEDDGRADPAQAGGDSVQEGDPARQCRGAQSECSQRGNDASQDQQKDGAHEPT